MLSHRIKHSKIKRPLTDGKSDSKLIDFVIEQLNERERFYLQAKHIVEGNDIKIDELLEIF